MSVKSPDNRPSFREDCLNLIRSSAVMTLATQSEYSAWSAPVYYLFINQQFYFFSNPDSRHVKEGESKVCGASIFRDNPSFDNLKGIQMSGQIRTGGKDMEAVKAAWSFCRHHKVKMKGMEEQETLSPTILTAFASIFHARLYLFEPDQVFYMDNTRGFGNRVQVEL